MLVGLFDKSRDLDALGSREVMVVMKVGIVVTAAVVLSEWVSVSVSVSVRASESESESESLSESVSLSVSGSVCAFRFGTGGVTVDFLATPMKLWKSTEKNVWTQTSVPVPLFRTTRGNGTSGGSSDVGLL